LLLCLQLQLLFLLDDAEAAWAEAASVLWLAEGIWGAEATIFYGWMG